MNDLITALAHVADDPARTELDRVDAALARDLMEGSDDYDVARWPAARDFIARTIARLVSNILPERLNGWVDGDTVIHPAPLEFEPADDPISSPEFCQGFTHDGIDTDDSHWFRCDTHGHLVIGEDTYVCEGYQAPLYAPYMEDEDALNLAELGAERDKSDE